jgi:TolB protein
MNEFFLYLRNMKILISIFMFFCAFLYAQQDTITMDIAVSTEKTLPIGVINFELDKSNWNRLEELPQKTLARDFLLSGRFTVIELEQYSLFALSREQAKHYVTGNLSMTDGLAKLECKLHVTTSRELVKDFIYTSPVEQVRSSLHKCADNVVYQLWGVHGFASTQLAWVSKINGERQIVIADYDGFRRRQITRHSGMNFLPAWSRDNSKIYFTSMRNDRSQIFERDLAGNTDKLLFPQIHQAFGTAVNPKDGTLLFTVMGQSGTDIWQGNPQTGRAYRLTFSSHIEVSPSWSQNGTAFLFTSDRGGGPQIYMAWRDGSDIQRISFEGTYNESAVWSPDGEQIAYSSMENGRFNIYTSAIDGSDVRKLTSEGNNERPTWSPDGMAIAFSSDRSGSSQIYIMRRDGSGATRITNAGENTSPVWSNLINQGENP